LATTAVGVSMLRERRHEWVNATLCRMLGYEAHELEGQLTRLHYVSDEVYESFGQEVYESLARTGRHTGEVQLRRRDGSLFWAQIDGHALDAANPRARCVCTYMDITQRKIAEAEIRQALEREKELGVLKTRLVSMASHEFRTPLATIQTNTELIAHYHERLAPDERQACLDQIQQGVDRMRQLMEDFLTLDRIGDSRRRLASAPCDLAELLSVFAAETRSADRHRHTIELAPPEVPLPPVMLDKALVQQIVSNLLSNACKYSPPGLPVTLAWARQGEWIDIDVRDRGIGVPPQDVPRLFGTFMRASNVGDVPGTGLGLVIVRQAAESHGGSVGVTSRVGEGTSFHVHLPFVLAS
jgi:PAS domain S-box-containing protein